MANTLKQPARIIKALGASAKICERVGPKIGISQKAPFGGSSRAIGDKWQHNGSPGHEDQSMPRDFCRGYLAAGRLPTGGAAMGPARRRSLCTGSGLTDTERQARAIPSGQLAVQDRWKPDEVIPATRGLYSQNQPSAAKSDGRQHDSRPAKPAMAILLPAQLGCTGHSAGRVPPRYSTGLAEYGLAAVASDEGGDRMAEGEGQDRSWVTPTQAPVCSPRQQFRPTIYQVTITTRNRHIARHACEPFVFPRENFSSGLKTALPLRVQTVTNAPITPNAGSAPGGYSIWH